MCRWYFNGTDEPWPPLDWPECLGLPGDGVRGGRSASSGDGTIAGGPSTAVSEPNPLSGLVLTPSVDLLRLSSSVDANSTKRSKPVLIRSCQSDSASINLSQIEFSNKIFNFKINKFSWG